MGKRKKKPLTADTIIYRLMNGYFASRWCMNPQEIQTIEDYIKTDLINDKKVIEKLIEFGFKVRLDGEIK